MVYTIRVYGNWTKNGGRRLPDVKHECYGKLSVKSFLKKNRDSMKYSPGTTGVLATGGPPILMSKAVFCNYRNVTWHGTVCPL